MAGVETARRTSTLTRVVEDRVIAGVCGGLAAHLEADPVWVRLGFVVGGLFWGVGLMLYALLWITLPEEPEEEGGAIRPPLASANPRAVAGILLLTIGLLVILWNILAHLPLMVVLPILAVGLGLFLLLHRRQ
jgi:phage shock protein PspC (stress-responsive transcriptional regulator)